MIDRSSWRACVGLLAVAALCAGVFGLGHQHGHGELQGDQALDEHHCVLCHVQQVAIEPVPSTDGMPTALSTARLLLDEPNRGIAFASRLIPPLRGPPVR